MIIEKTNKDESAGFYFGSRKSTVMTEGFKEKFADSLSLSITTLSAIRTLVDNSNGEGIDYLQIYKYNDITYWIIEDRDVITFLMPDEY